MIGYIVNIRSNVSQSTFRKFEMQMCGWTVARSHNQHATFGKIQTQQPNAQQTKILSTNIATCLNIDSNEISVQTINFEVMPPRDNVKKNRQYNAPTITNTIC